MSQQRSIRDTPEAWPLEALISYDHGDLVAVWHQHGVVEREQHEQGAELLEVVLKASATVARVQQRDRARQ